VGFQFVTAAIMNITAIWDVAPCILIEADRNFRGRYCLHHQDDEIYYYMLPLVMTDIQ
jgi:hypothetical protein